MSEQSPAEAPGAMSLRKMAGTPGEESPPVVRPEMAMVVQPVVGLRVELAAVLSLR